MAVISVFFFRARETTETLRLASNTPLLDHTVTNVT